jgi:cytochrome c peroxidase
LRASSFLLSVAAAAALGYGVAGASRARSAARAKGDPSRDALLAAAIRTHLDSQLERLAGALDSLAIALKSADRRRAERAFHAARTAYKESECLLTAYSPPTVAALNGPVAESDGDAPPPPLGAPADFQQVEAVLFGSDRPVGGDGGMFEAAGVAAAMRRLALDFRAQTQLVTVGQAALLDAVRAEVARVTTLGIAGVDLDRPADIAVESAAALEGMAPLVSAAARLADGGAAASAWESTAAALRVAAAHLREDPEFRSFDRMSFITDYMGVVARSLGRVRAALPASRLALRRVWSPAAGSVFDSNAFDPSAYAPEFAPASTPELVALGKKLFFDVRLSGPRTRSCGSCHDPSRAFTDGRARALTLDTGAQPTARNTPTLINAALEPALFADQRAGSLEDQVARVLSSAAEMRSSPELAAARLGADEAYRAAFRRAIAGARDSAVTALGVRVALAAYVRSLIALDSRFDRAVRGEPGMLTRSERRGFDLFAGRARCATCHFMPLFSGVAPPEFVTSEPEIIGVPGAQSARAPMLDGDPGREGVDHAAAHKFAFKVPTLRNVALTAPYMHNGVFRTLDQVVEFYDRGGGSGAGIRVPGQTLSAKPLHLRAGERRDLVAFLGALTDTVVPRVP